MQPTRLASRFVNFRIPHRCYKVLAIESSCDDSCVALLEKHTPNSYPVTVDEQKATLNSAKTGGIIPTAAHEFHQQNIALLVERFCGKHNISASNPPDLICVTRGPGMVGLLSAGLQFAKALAVAWNRPLIGVHHMLGHLLTAKLPLKTSSPDDLRYPFLSLLCSGGHTMLVLLKSLTDHEIIINTLDIAAGDSLDKCARELGFSGNMLGPELEKFVENIDEDKKNRFAQIKTHDANNEFGFRLKMPMRNTKRSKIPEKIEFGFASFLSTITSYKKDGLMTEESREFVAYKLQEVIFDHIVNRIQVAFMKHNLSEDNKFDEGILEAVNDFVCSGGVAANKVLRSKLFNDLDAGHTLKFHFPDLALCTDNATMIGNAGIEIFENLKKRSSLSILPIRKWPMNELLDVDGWLDVPENEYNSIVGFSNNK
ncbi:peptidase M22, glycoprotease [Metschnikowia bicuspidata var. bicuspidata NRRL YB-4993]|uniref:N(6)-L-threonylcarbamoyladenine synthase n=1 Tax=Metschnikowia bicuspidata var. bicuspidata NRRL YB-4993 TaxID=869754 RepID=A0A1A0H603_9ASCO|nr:peptidase M22, glycoprotease [Metschnikowia bicuspidata var. bicuspidata NRRL YB-4993]OBA19385.1 peptidase M22, glycoprotease [Metschnikowia bicuspidata var. bicuspidata NRRL YB-4993]